MADYLLIKLMNSVETVDNVIVASPEVAATYLVANSGAYDYVLDRSMYSPTPNIGDTYDPGMDTFTAATEDLEADLEAALMAVNTAIEAAGLAYEAAATGQRSTAIGNVLSELAEEPEDQVNLMIALSTYLETLVS